MTNDQPSSRLRAAFIQRLGQLPIKPKAISHYVRWAEAWTKARGHQSPQRTREWFEALGRSTSIADWQLRQASSHEWDYARASHIYVSLRLSTHQH